MYREKKERTERGSHRWMWSPHKVFMCVLLKEGTLRNAVQVGTWQKGL